MDTDNLLKKEANIILKNANMGRRFVILLQLMDS